MGREQGGMGGGPFPGRSKRPRDNDSGPLVDDNGTIREFETVRTIDPDRREMHKRALDEFRDEFSAPHAIMVGPTMLSAAPKLKEVVKSPLLDRDDVDVLVPHAFTIALHREDRLHVREQILRVFARDAQPADWLDVVKFVDRDGVSKFSSSEVDLGFDVNKDLDWERSLQAGEEDTRSSENQTVVANLQFVLQDMLAFLVTSSTLFSRVSYSVDRIRDAGVRVVDVGKARLNSQYEETLRGLEWGDLAKFATFGIANSAPQWMDPVWGAMLQTSIDCTLYMVDP